MRRSIGYLQGLLLTGVLLFLVFRGIDFASVWTHIQEASIPLLVLSALVQLASLPVRVLRWKTILQPVTRHLDHRLMLEATFLGYTTSAVVPGRLGELVRPGLLAARGQVPIGAGLGSILAERLLDTATILGVLAVGIGVVPFAGEAAAYAPSIRQAGLASLLIVLLALGTLLAVLAKRSFLERQAERRGRLLGWILRSMAAVAEGTRAFGSPRLLGRLTVESIATWGIVLVGFWMVFEALGIDLSPKASLILLPLTVVGVALPTPAGAGGYHAAVSFGLTVLFGVEPALAASAAVLAHLTAFFPILVIGALLLLGGRFSFRDILAIGRRVREMGARSDEPKPPAAS